MWFRVKFTESERGWGQKDWFEYFETFEQAKTAIRECNKLNEDDYAKTKSVPDYYIQADETIVAVDETT